MLLGYTCSRGFKPALKNPVTLYNLHYRFITDTILQCGDLHTPARQNTKYLYDNTLETLISTMSYTLGDEHVS